MKTFLSTAAILLAVILVSAANAAPPPPVTALAYRSDGTHLAAGLRGEVLLFDAKLTNVGRIVDQTGPVTALAWSHDGSRLAVASGIAGKVGEVRLYAWPPSGPIPTKPEKTIAAHTDRIHDLAFSPDGKTLATCSYDRLIKLLDVASGTEIRTLKDHSDSVYGISFRPDGKLLASAAADRTVKVWDTSTGTRLYSLSDPTDWVYAVAWHPDGKRLAAAGADKSIRIWEANEKEGKLLRSAFAHEKPVLRLAFTADGKTLFSMSEDKIIKAWDADRLTEKRIFAAQPDSVLAMAVRPDGKQLALGRYDGALVLLDAETGKVVAEPLPEKPKPPILDRFPTRPEPAGTESPRTAPEIPLQTTVLGTLSRAGEIDYYRIRLKAGQEVGVQIQPATGGKIEPVLTLEDATGKILTETTAGVLGYRCEKEGAFLLALRDREYRGGAEFRYRLSLGDIPIVTSYFPLGGRRGENLNVSIRGVHLGGLDRTSILLKDDAAIGSRVPLIISSKRGPILNLPAIVVGEFEEVNNADRLPPIGRAVWLPNGKLRHDLVDHQPEMTIPVPGTGNGIIDVSGHSQTWPFPAKKGQPLIVEIEARRLGSSLDSVIEILDEKDRPVPWAVLRCAAKTTVAFRDHDSAVSGIRMDTWNEFAIDDFVVIGNELMRIRELPRGPDDDCQFYAVSAQRVGYFGTTPSHHAMSSPMFKVGIFPPGSTFPANGMPVFPLTYRNDDGGPGYGKDSRLRFDPPADGVYKVRVADARGQGGPDFGYRLTVRPPRPNFSVKFQPTTPAVWKGGGVPITVTADRFDDFDGPIELKLTDLPPGFHAPSTFIEAGQISTTFTLFGDEKASQPDAKHPPFKLAASATIDGKTVTHDAVGSVPKLVDPGDIVTTTAQSTVTIHPGHETRLLVHVERRNGFKGRIPVDVLGLPHGVRVLNIGLNGILVTERDTSREIVIYAEPWVQPMSHPFVVLAKRESKGTDHAADSVLLKVEK